MMEIFWHLVFCLLSYFLLIQDFPNKTKPYVDIKNKKLQLYMHNHKGFRKRKKTMHLFAEGKSQCKSFTVVCVFWNFIMESEYSST